MPEIIIEIRFLLVEFTRFNFIKKIGKKFPHSLRSDREPDTFTDRFNKKVPISV